MKVNSEFKDQMIQELNAILTPGEILYAPIYGTLCLKKASFPAFFGLTKKFMLVALMDANGISVIEQLRIPLNIRSVRVKRNLISVQQKIFIDFREGNPCTLRVSKQVFQLDCQKYNLEEFIKRLQVIAS